MSIRPINLYGDKILNKKMKPVAGLDDKTRKDIQDMFETMKPAHGMGLAANQVGINKAIFIIDLSPVEGYEKAKPMVLINPKIINASDETCVLEEGCLSIPDVRVKVERSEKVKVEFFDINFDLQQLDADELLARVIQHEYDHLQGIYMTDRISEEFKKRLKKRLTKIKNRQLDFDYPVTPKPKQ